ncbi:MAG TPA: class I SAM-dependent methyltransferase [Dermatophilaceae bacterium]|nr:class I SAM-dependent methyltransferase [Dermatophilaceae bacterium]
MDELTARLLTSLDGLALLAALPRYQESMALRLGEELRRAGHEPGLVAAVLTQSRLRERARAKLGEFAAGMLFTPDGLEQCTRLVLAARHAHRFRAAGIGHVLDLGCGLGSDAMALSSLDVAVTAVEADPATAILAAHNLRHFPRTRVLAARAQDLDIRGGADARCGELGAWLDPARRHLRQTDPTGRSRRVFSLEELSPPWSFVTAVAKRIPATGAKLGPTFPAAALPAGCQAQWTSLAGEVLECTVWWGPLVSTPGRSATVIRAGHDVTLAETDASHHGHPAGRRPSPGSYLYDPDRALLAADLLGVLMAAVDGVELATGVGYVVADRAVDVGYATRYRLVEALPLRTTTIRAWLRARAVGRLTVKKRGIRLDPDAFRSALRLDGRGPEATVVLTRAGTSSVCLVVERDIVERDIVERDAPRG